MDIPSRIEALQFALGCTQAEVAERLGIGLSMFHYIRKGERNASRKVVSKLEAAEQAAGIGEKPEISHEKEDWTPEPGIIAEDSPESGSVPVDCPAGISRLEAMLALLLLKIDGLESKIDQIMKER